MPSLDPRSASHTCKMKEKQYILVADVGSTKADCALANRADGSAVKFTTGGLNALIANDEAIEHFLTEISSHIPENSVPYAVYYYGAGCATPEICRRMEGKIAEYFGGAEAYVASDLLGAARSLLGHSPGIACILGTGSNSCLYDGHKITDNISPLGYILGDEGSGTALGKRLLGDYFKRLLPASLHKAFKKEYGLTMADALDNVYRSQTPNKFLASFVPFLKANEEDPYIRQLLREEFSKFFERNISRYKAPMFSPISFTGGVAFNFGNYLCEIAMDYNYSIGQISLRPMKGLIDYHLNNN